MNDTGNILGFIDSDLNSSVVTGIVQIRGWELHRPGNEPAIVVRLDGKVADTWTERYLRPDVTNVYPAMASANPLPGFTVAANITHFSNGLHTLTCEVQCGQDVTVLGTFAVTVDNGLVLAVYKHAHLDPGSHRGLVKLKKIVEVLQCPLCGSGLVLCSESRLECRTCHHPFAVQNFAPIMLTGSPEYSVDEVMLGSPPSNNPYPGPVLSELHKVISTGGLALDIGSGRRSFGFPELVQMEICAYPHTDVVNQSENLPFRDESFDFVFALAVTEHVRRPWVLASEMQRVLKNGGTIHVDSAFLQPIHGYPSHYYNMTHFALRSLFNDLTVVSLQPAPYQHPWYSINWILDHALVDIPPDQKSLLCAMTFEGVLAELKRYCTDHSGVFAGISLPQHRIEELAAGFTLIGQKIAGPVEAENRPAADATRR